MQSRTFQPAAAPWEALSFLRQFTNLLYTLHTGTYLDLCVAPFSLQNSGFRTENEVNLLSILGANSSQLDAITQLSLGDIGDYKFPNKMLWHKIVKCLRR